MTSGLEFYFFPRRQTPRLEMDAKAKTVSVVMADGGRVSFDPATAQIASLDRGDVTVSPNLDRAAQGGVTITHYRGLMLESGFRLGELPSGLAGNSSTFVAPEGRTCTVTNAEIFNYTPSGDSSFKFDDAQLSKFLKTRCPALPVGF